LAEQVDLVLAEAVAQVIGDGHGVVDGAVEGQGAGGVELVVGVPGAPLIPGDDGEVFFEVGEVLAHGSHFGSAGSAGEEEQHGVVDAVTSDELREVVAVGVCLTKSRSGAGAFGP
jgi:hypothetical protein